MSTTFFTATPEQILRARTKATWEAGDYGVVARYAEPAAEEFISRLNLVPEQQVLDVACGTGNLAILAARAGCATWGIDLATNLVSQARARAAAQGLAGEFIEGDAESLPFPNGKFDAVVSMFGVMFAPNPERAAAELLRVCRPGGVVALANWTQEGFIGDNFRVVSRHVLPRPGAPSPLGWGDESTVRARLGEGVTGLRLSRRMARWRYPFPPARAVDFLRQFYGPTLRAFGVLAPVDQAHLHFELEESFRRHNLDQNGATEIEAEYLEVIGTRR